MTESPTWSEDNSRIYREIAAVAVPRRDEQIAALLTLAPMKADAKSMIVELGCGEGLLGHALLAAFPSARYLGLDGSESMRAASAERLRPFGSRAQVAAFDLPDPSWLPFADGADLIVSSLCVHHLDGTGKQALFRGLAPRLSRRGALLLADLVDPPTAPANELFAETWYETVALQSRARVGDDSLAETFLEEAWNHYRTPDPVDRPSRLFDQLVWLRDAGFALVDCFWLNAGHAIYGGYKTSDASAIEPGRYRRNLAIARDVLGLAP